MKKRFFSLFLCAALLLSIACPAHTARAASSSDDDGGTYTDPETGATFVVPEGWNEVTLDEESPDFFQVEFDSSKYFGRAILYMRCDLQSLSTGSKLSSSIISDIDTAYLYAYEDGAFIEKLPEFLIEGMLEAANDSMNDIRVDDIRLATYGKNEFIEITVSMEMSGIRISYPVILHIENGYLYLFSLLDIDGRATQDFHAILSSFQGSPVEGSLSGGDSDPANLPLRSFDFKGALFVLEFIVSPAPSLLRYFMFFVGI